MNEKELKQIKIALLDYGVLISDLEVNDLQPYDLKQQSKVLQKAIDIINKYTEPELYTEKDFIEECEE